MTVKPSTLDINKASYFVLDKTEDEKDENKLKYNSFMNFMTDVIVKYGLNNEEKLA